jgi:hypothetical protein
MSRFLGENGNFRFFLNCMGTLRYSIRLWFSRLWHHISPSVGIILPWWWRQHIPLKRLHPSTKVHGIITQKTTIWTVSTINISKDLCDEELYKYVCRSCLETSACKISVCMQVHTLHHDIRQSRKLPIIQEGSWFSYPDGATSVHP